MKKEGFIMNHSRITKLNLVSLDFINVRNLILLVEWKIELICI